jgi:hypothetical protein
LQQQLSTCKELPLHTNTESTFVPCRIVHIQNMAR